MVVVTVKYEGETYVSKPLEKDYNDVCLTISGATDNFHLRLGDNKLVFLKSEAIKRAVFLVEEVDE